MMMASTNKPLSWPLWSGILSLLLLPLIAMQFTCDINWTGSDFLMAALLLGTGGAAYELAIRTVRRRERRAIVIALIAAIIVMIWAQGAVGII